MGTRPTRSSWKCALITLISACTLIGAPSGCSLLGVQEVEDPARRALKLRERAGEPVEEIKTECTDSVAAPVVDTVMGGIFATNTISVAAMPEQTSSAIGVDSTTLVLTGLLASALYLTSAGWGFDTTADCREFRRKVRGQAESTEDRDEELEELRRRVRRLESRSKSNRDD
ncbi:MAG: hypothetical protein QM784_17665 [Polyangiaceae bacterium]